MEEKSKVVIAKPFTKPVKSSEYVVKQGDQTDARVYSEPEYDDSGEEQEIRDSKS